jgi:factor associated with neutral sphingomyelinase activation
MQAPTITYFWESNVKTKSRSRFNLLLLEYGEYFFEDLSVYSFPIPNGDINNISSFRECDSNKTQGRLKLCSRSLIFEPNEVRKPLIKYSFKSMTSPVKEELNPYDQFSVELSGLFTFFCSSYIEMKANDKIGPYKQVDDVNTRVLFGLVHSELSHLLTRIETIRHIFSTGSPQLLKPLTEQASIIHNFDTSQLVDFHEKLLLEKPISVKKVKPLILHPGSLMITKARVYFQPAQLNNIGDKVQYFDLRKVQKLYRRRYLLRQTGLEFILQDGSSHLYIFETKELREIMYNLIKSQLNDGKSTPSLDIITRKWQRREISNFDYLMCLNNEADRSINDLTQYPVFPHIIADYTSSTLDLGNPSTFRDLSKPVGALNSQRLEYFKDRFHSMPPADTTYGIPPPFLFGTHYSTPGYVLFYLVRVAPEFMLCLQNGKFDSTDRMFNSVGEMWSSCYTNPADLKELIPEFFSGNGDFLTNIEDLDLGHRHTGDRVNDVLLPPWAKKPKDFIRKNIKALESDYVSQNLHHWIDLIFGNKQQGQAAIDADNLYFHLTYEGSINFDNITDPRERSAIELQIQEFGQTPTQLFAGSHPSRDNLDGYINLCDVVGISTSETPLKHNKDNITLLSPDSSVKSKIDKISKSLVNNNNNNKNNNDDDDNDDNEIINEIRLGDEFAIEVAKELLSSNQSQGISNSISPAIIVDSTHQNNLPAAAVSTFFNSLKGKTATVLNRTFGAGLFSPVEELSLNNPPIPPPSNKIQENNENISISSGNKLSGLSRLLNEEIITVSVSLSNQDDDDDCNNTWREGKIQENPSNKISIKQELKPPLHGKELSPSLQGQLSKLALQPSESFCPHSEAITGVGITHQNTSIMKDKVIICSCSKDSSIKIIHANINSLTRNINNTYNFEVKRTFNSSSSDPPLSSCCLSNDASIVIAGGWDNNIYSYSVPNACSLGRKGCHDDSVSSIALDFR